VSVGTYSQTSSIWIRHRYHGNIWKEGPTSSRETGRYGQRAGSPDGQTTGYNPSYNLCRWRCQSEALKIFRGDSRSKSAARRLEARRYDPRVVVQFNKKAYANTDIILFWLQELLLPGLGARPFTDILKDEIDKDSELQELHSDEVTTRSAVGEMRVMMTRCVAEAWEIDLRQMV